MKRGGSELDTGGSSKKGAASCDGVVQPIPRMLHQHSIVIPFFQRTWEEIGPGELKYIPLCQSPKYMMDQAQLNLFNKFKPLWATMRIVSEPSIRMSNLIMLQDDLRVQANTPTDATAFTQVVYMMSYTPTNQSNYFKLQHRKDQSYEGVDLTYDLQPVTSKTGGDTQLVTLANFDNFEELMLCPASVNQQAGFVSAQVPKLDPLDYSIQDTYIAPNCNSSLSMYAANMQPQGTDKYVTNGQHITMVRNMNGLKFHKYGDTLSMNINTNLHNVPLANVDVNDFTHDTTVQITRQGNPIQYDTEFVWPSRNRPFYSRRNNYDLNTDPLTKAKEVGHLSHHFIAMPPIRKPNGAMLGQRCSFYMETEMAIEFTFPTAIYDGDTSQRMLDQTDAVIVRRNVYGKTKQGPIKAGPVCKGNIQCKTPAPSTQSADVCVINNWTGWNDIVYNSPDPSVIKVFDWVVNDIPVGTILIGKTSQYAALDKIYAETKEKWIDYVGTEQTVAMEVVNPRPIGGTTDSFPLVGSYKEGVAGVKVVKYTIKPAEFNPITDKLYLLVDMLGWDDLVKASGMSCEDTQNAPYVTSDHTCSTFYC